MIVASGQEAAIKMMRQIQVWCMEDDSGLGKEKLQGLIPTSSLATPMMALCLCEQMDECDIKWWENDNLKTWAVEEIQLHVQVGLYAFVAARSYGGPDLKSVLFLEKWRKNSRKRFFFWKRIVRIFWKVTEPW